MIISYMQWNVIQNFVIVLDRIKVYSFQIISVFESKINSAKFV